MNLFYEIILAVPKISFRRPEENSERQEQQTGRKAPATSCRGASTTQMAC